MWHQPAKLFTECFEIAVGDTTKNRTRHRTSASLTRHTKAHLTRFAARGTPPASQRCQCPRADRIDRLTSGAGGQPYFRAADCQLQATLDLRCAHIPALMNANIDLSSATLGPQKSPKPRNTSTSAPGRLPCRWLAMLNHQALSAEDRRATVGEQIPSRAAAPGQRPGQGEMRGLGAIALSSRASLQPPFATLPVTGHVRLSPKILRHRRRNRTAQQPILVFACDTEAPAQSTCAQGARWHGFPLPPPRPYIYFRPLTPTSLRHRRRNRTAQQPIPVRACDAEAHFSAFR